MSILPDATDLIFKQIEQRSNQLSLAGTLGDLKCHHASDNGAQRIANLEKELHETTERIQAQQQEINRLRTMPQMSKGSDTVSLTVVTQLLGIIGRLQYEQSETITRSGLDLQILAEQHNLQLDNWLLPNTDSLDKTLKRKRDNDDTIEAATM